MIEHILIPTDGSSAAKAGVEQGVALAALLGAQVTFLAYAQSLADQAGVLQGGCMVDNRRVDQAICAAAHQHSCDLIVIGSARTPAKGLFTPSSCARRLAGEAPVPVLIVH